jgi:hypothetical protein
LKCPICDRDNDRDARRCRSCGADFEDPEVAAQLDRPRPDEDADGEIDLSGGRYLGVRWIGFEVGGDLRRLALIGGALFALIALLPVKLDFGGVQASWSALDHGPKLALVLPFVLAAIGIALGTPLGRGIPPVAVAGVLAAAGAAALPLAFTPMGQHAGTTIHTLWLPWFGTAIAGAGVALRVLRRKDPHVRWIIVGGAVLVVLGMLLPHGDAREYLPGEFSLYLRGKELADSGLLSAWTEGFDNDSMVRFLSLWHLLEIGLLGLAIVLAMRPSTGPWDSMGMALRPLGVVLIFHLTFTFVLYTLNVMGWSAFDRVYWKDHFYAWDSFTGGMFAGRARLALLSLPTTLWLTAGLVGLYVNLAPRPAAAAPAPGPGPDRPAA